MTFSLTEALLIGTTLMHGFLAGGNVERALVHMPAWRKVGARAWAAFSRQADLGRGLFLYPFEAITGAALAVAAAIAFQFELGAVTGGGAPALPGRGPGAGRPAGHHPGRSQDAQLAPPAR